MIMSGKSLKIIPNAKLPFKTLRVLNTDSSGSRPFKASVINKVITSVSVWDLNLKPFFSSILFKSSEFSIIQL